MTLLPEPFPNLSTNPISHNGIAHCPTCAQAQARPERGANRRVGLRRHQQDELSTGTSLPMPGKASVVLRFQQPT